MTTPDERMRHLVQTGAFLIELAVHRGCPVEVRMHAARLACHYPTDWDLRLIGRESTQLCSEIDPAWLAEYPRGPLTAAAAESFALLIQAGGM